MASRRKERNLSRDKSASLNNEIEFLKEMFHNNYNVMFIEKILKAHNCNVEQAASYLLTFSSTNVTPVNTSVIPNTMPTFPNTKQQNLNVYRGTPIVKLPSHNATQIPIGQLQAQPKPIVQNSTGAIKKLPQNKHEIHFHHIIDLIKKGYRVVVLLRGVPGSGKSHLARRIFNLTVGDMETLHERHIFSSDDFFSWLGVGKYKFDPSRLSEAHQWNQNRFREAVRNNVSPVIVDNTNCQDWEMRPYVIEGMLNGYYIEILEPFTTWAKNARELTKRNIHDVPKQKIKDMLDRFQLPDLTGEQLLSIWGLTYATGNEPPKMRSFPPIVAKTKEQPTTVPKNKKPAKVKELSSDDDSNSLSDNKHLQKVFARHKDCPNLEHFINNVINKSVDDHNNISNDLKSTHRYTKEQLLGILPSQYHDIINKRILNETDEFTIREKRSNSKEPIHIPTIVEVNDNTSVSDEADLINWDIVDEQWNENWDENLIEKKSEDNNNPLPKRNRKCYSLIDEDPIFDDDSLSPIKHNSDTQVIVNNKLIDLSIPDKFGTEIINNNSETSEKSITEPIIRILTNLSINDQESNEKPTKKESILDNLPKPSLVSTFKRFFSRNTNDNGYLHHSSDGTKSEKPSECCMIETCEFGTNVNEFELTNNKNYVRIIDTNNRDINEGLVGNVNTWKEGKIDKSSMTYNDDDVFLDMAECESNDTNVFKDLTILFPHIRKEYLKDIYIKCRGNVNWAAATLLDSPDLSPFFKDPTDQSSDENENDEVSTTNQLNDSENVGIVDDNVNSNEKDMVALLEARKHVEEQIVIGDNHYSEHVLKIKRLRHGEPVEIENNDNSSTSDSNSVEDDEVIELNLGFDFVKRLDKLFGSTSKDYADGLQPIIQVPRALAEQLHLLWLESYYQQFSAHEERLEQMVKEDEEFARQLQQQENEHNASGQRPNVPTIQEIMNMEIDLAIAQHDTVMNDCDDLATQMTKQKLCDLFPDIERETLFQVLQAYDNRYDKTVETLMSDANVFSKSTNVINEEVLSSQEQQILENAKKSLEKSVSEQHKPVIVVRDPRKEKAHHTEEQFSDAKYYRELAQNELKLRDQCFQKASDMYRRGMTSAALCYSDLAQVHKNKFEKANQYAAMLFLNEHTENHGNNVFDLHFLHVKEALHALDIFIDNHITHLRENNKKKTVLHIITGRGSHSVGNRARIKPAVLRRLKQRNLSWHFLNPGLLKLKIHPYDIITSQL